MPGLTDETLTEIRDGNKINQVYIKKKYFLFF